MPSHAWNRSRISRGANCLPSHTGRMIERQTPRMATSGALMIFFFNDPPTTEIYTLSLHDALPISQATIDQVTQSLRAAAVSEDGRQLLDRKSTRLNSSHVEISYAVFCLKKKKITSYTPYTHHTRSNINRYLS